MRGQWTYQVDRRRVLEVYWTAVEIPEGDAKFLARFSAYAGGVEPENWYGAIIDWAGKILNSRKMLRDFEQIGQEGNRCTLCGARSALADYVVRDRPERKQRSHLVRHTHGRLVAYWNAAQRQLPHRFRGSERLCAVCVVRRLAPLEYFHRKVFPDFDSDLKVEFPSTSTLATAHAVADLIKIAEQQDEVKQVLAGFVKNLGQDASKCSRPPRIDGPLLPCFDSLSDDVLKGFAACDGDWFYEDHYSHPSLEREYNLETGEAKECFPINRARELKEALRKLGVEFQPSNYLAVIRADGDHMGDWICGRRDPDEYSPKWQARLSQCLALFAKALQERLEKGMPGKLVYAGGDDLLAFVPRERALEAMEHIDAAFRGSVGSLAPEMTLSMACILARHNDPLSYVVERSEKLLKDYAKKKYGRNAIAIERTTGGAEVTGFRIRTPGCELLERVRKLHDDLKRMVSTDREGLSARILKQLEELREGLKRWEGEEAALREARQEMLRYAVSRHFHAAAADKEDRKQEVREAQDLLCGLYTGLEEWQSFLEKETDKPGASGDERLGLFEQLLRLLSMLRFLTREGR